jgi:hypothetical protein
MRSGRTCAPRSGPARPARGSSPAALLSLAIGIGANAAIFSTDRVISLRQD